MIIEPTIKHDQNGNAYNEIVNNGDPYWACGYTPDNVVRLMSEELNPIESKALASKLNGFGATTYQELLEEITNRGLTIQEGLI